MAADTPQQPNPNRVKAGRLNRQKRKGLTPEGREKLRQAALAFQPWQHATGPTTPEGKAKAAQNGKVRQKGPRSVREIKSDLAEVYALLATMRTSRRSEEKA